MHGYPTKVLVMNRGDHFRFASVFIKKITKLNLKKKTETEPKPVQTEWFQFGFFGQKPVQTGWLGLARFFQFWLGFFLFDSGFFGLGSVRFFQFQAYKTEPNHLVFYNFTRFNLVFFTVWFFRLFFSDFLGLIGFLVFLLTPSYEIYS
jgi:hypothetical protein